MHIIIRRLNHSFCVPNAKSLAPSKMLRSYELRYLFCLIPYAGGLTPHSIVKLFKFNTNF
jgi:hypothetical protein